MAILRSIAGIIVGYIVCAVIVVACFTGLQFGLGTEKVFKPGSWEAADWFVIAGLGVSFIAAIIGGLVCMLIGRSRVAVMVLAALFLVLGFLSGFLNHSKADPGPRIGTVSPMEAAAKGKQPDWYAFSIPVVGALGVMLGGRLKRS